MATFKEQVIEVLPEGHEFTTIYSKTPEASIVKTRYNGRVYELTMGKIDLKSLFPRLIVIPVGLDETFDDVYNRISERYGLGLVKGVDYYNAEKVQPLDSLQFISLPLLPDSYGYHGNIDCFIIQASVTLATDLTVRDLTEVDQSYITRDLWTRTALVSEIFTSDKPMFFQDKLSSSFAKVIFGKLGGRSSITLDHLSKATVVDLLNDELSDIMVLRLINGIEYLVRFQSELKDLPVVILISTDDENQLDENSKEISSGETVEELGWEQWKSEGGVSIGMLALPLGNHPIPSLPPKEDTITPGEELKIPFINFEDEDVTWFE